MGSRRSGRFVRVLSALRVVRTATTDAGNESAATVMDRGRREYVSCSRVRALRRLAPGGGGDVRPPIHADRLPSIAGNPASAVQGVRRFDYGSLPLEKAQALRESRTRIHTEIKKTAACIIAIGRELIVVKKTLPHGAFQAWVSSECGVSLRSAQNYMRVARLADKNATVAFLPLGTAYRMTGRRTSRWMLDAAAERVDEGEDMTEAAFERLYKMFLDSKKRQARRKSRGSVQNAASRKSEQNSRTHIAGPSPRADVADEFSSAPFNGNPPLPEWAVSNAEYFVNEYGEGIWFGLLILWRIGELDDLMRALWKKLRN
jgi:hypothetical protein